jgi:hypothetical protein
MAKITPPREGTQEIKSADDYSNRVYFGKMLSYLRRIPTALPFSVCPERQEHTLFAVTSGLNPELMTQRRNGIYWVSSYIHALTNWYIHILLKLFNTDFRRVLTVI